MIDTIRAEFRKLLTIRSSYVIAGIALLIIGLIAGWGMGYKGSALLSPDSLQQAATMGLTVAGTFIGVVAILAITHEYRYNTINYTLTISNSRMKVLFAKLLVVSVYALILMVAAAAFAMLMLLLGANIAGHDTGKQMVDAGSLLWKGAAYTVGSAWLGLILGFLSRSVVFAIAAYFIIPTVEPLLNMLLKISNNYLPSASQQQILSGATGPDMFSPLASAGVFAIYLVVGLVVSSILFIKRDANA